MLIGGNKDEKKSEEIQESEISSVNIGTDIDRAGEGGIEESGTTSLGEVSLPEAGAPGSSPLDTEQVGDGGEGQVGLSSAIPPPNEHDAFDSVRRVVQALGQGTPLNFYGPMGSGKSTLGKCIGYSMLEDSDLWKCVADGVAPDVTGTQLGDIFDLIGSDLPDLLHKIVSLRLTQDDAAYKKVILNLWIPYLEDPFLNVYLLPRRDEVITEERLSSVSAEEHYVSVRRIMEPYFNKDNVVVFYTEDEVQMLKEALDE